MVLDGRITTSFARIARGSNGDNPMQKVVVVESQHQRRCEKTHREQINSQADSEGQHSSVDVVKGQHLVGAKDGGEDPQSDSHLSIGSIMEHRKINLPRRQQRGGRATKWQPCKHRVERSV